MLPIVKAVDVHIFCVPSGSLPLENGGDAWYRQCGSAGDIGAAVLQV